MAPSPILTLSPDILLCILDYLGPVFSICLGLASEKLYAVTRNRYLRMPLETKVIPPKHDLEHSQLVFAYLYEYFPEGEPDENPMPLTYLFDLFPVDDLRRQNLSRRSTIAEWQKTAESGCLEEMVGMKMATMGHFLEVVRSHERGESKVWLVETVKIETGVSSGEDCGKSITIAHV